MGRRPMQDYRLWGHGNPGVGGCRGAVDDEGVTLCLPRREEDRCRQCYRLRLEQTVHAARRHGFTHFSTSLLYSRRQKHEEIVEEARGAEKRSGVEFYCRDLRPTWQQGIDLSKEWGVYRQNYCGCIYSEAERFARQLEKIQSDAAVLA